MFRMRTTFVLTALLGAASLAHAQYQPQYQQGPPPPPPQQGYGQGNYGPPPQQGQGNYGPPPQGQGGWDAPPPEFAEAQRRGFHDGIEGARKDFENHRPPNVNNRDEFRHPGFIAPPDRRSYKMGFRRGYDVAVRHMYGPGPGGPR